MGFWTKPPSLDGLPVWMDPGEFSQLLAAIEAVQPRRFLEWGTGGSTRAFLEQCPFIEQYVAVEHNAGWVDQVRKVVTDSRLRLHLVLPDVPDDGKSPGRANPDLPAAQSAAWDDRAEFDPALLATYIATPRTLGFQPDFALVDGRARRFCLREAFDLVRPGGMVALHDAQRPEYHDVLHALGRPLFLTPWAQGQVCLLHKPG